MAEPAAENPDLNELLGSDSDGGVEEEKEKQNELNELLGGSDDEEENVQSEKVSQRTMDEYYPTGTENSDGRIDELEQILGKVEAKSGTKEMKSKTRSKILLQSTYKVPGSHTTSIVRAPNFLKIQTIEYDESIYRADSERKSMDGCTAVVRWRYKRNEMGEIMTDAHGKPVTESNARMLQWADGTVQLIVGDAVFQCKSSDVDNW